MFKFQNPNKVAPSGYLTIAEYAKKCGLSRGSIYLKIRLGQIPKEKLLEVKVEDTILFIKED